ncbi:MAG: S1/P1 nuclease [Alistipes finegoldii]
MGRKEKQQNTLKHEETPFIAAFAALTSAQGAFAWGRLGHAAVARLAEQHLTKKAKANLDKLLDGRSIVYYASWMDDYKPQMLVDLGYTPTNGPRMHMLPHTFSVDENGEVIRGNRLPGDKYLANCLYYVERAADRLKNRMHEMNDSTRLACIQVIVHCLGTCTAPDTSAGGQSGNRLLQRRPQRQRNPLPHDLGHPDRSDDHPWSFSDLAFQLDRYTEEQQRAAIAGDIYDWGRESAANSKCIYDVKPGDKLGHDFILKYKPLAEEQLAKAGYRLARSSTTFSTVSNPRRDLPGPKNLRVILNSICFAIFVPAVWAHSRRTDP